MRIPTFIFASIIISLLFVPSLSRESGNKDNYIDEDEFEGGDVSHTSSNSEKINPQNTNDENEFDGDDDEDEFSGQTSTPTRNNDQKLKKPMEKKYEKPKKKQNFDEDEFVGSSSSDDIEDKDDSKKDGTGEVKFTIADISTKSFKITDYGIEVMYIVIILIYTIFFFIGKSRNDGIAESWFRSYGEILESNFAKIGSDTMFLKDGQHVFVLRGSGRQNCVGIQVVLELFKRHDVFYTMYQLFKKVKDKVTIDIVLETMDPFVFSIISNNHVKDYKQNYKDLKLFTKHREFSDADNFPEDKFTVLSETEEVLPLILTPKVMEVLDTHCDSIEAIHFTDQFQNKSHKQLIRFVFYLPQKQDSEGHKTLLNMAMYFIDHVAAIGISAEGKKKASERRAKAQAEQEKEKQEEKLEILRKKQEDKKKKEEERIKKLTPEQLAKEEARLRRREARKASKVKVVFG